MTEIKKLSRLIKLYGIAYKAYKLCPNRVSHFILTKIYKRIQNMYNKHQGLEQIFDSISNIRESIKKMYEPIMFITMNKIQARNYLEKLVKERNNANNLYRREYEQVINKSVYECMKLGFTFLIAKNDDEWKIMK